MEMSFNIYVQLSQFGKGSFNIGWTVVVGLGYVVKASHTKLGYKHLSCPNNYITIGRKFKAHGQVAII